LGIPKAKRGSEKREERKEVGRVTSGQGKTGREKKTKIKEEGCRARQGKG
jgi:hypothetical protein